MKRKKIKDLIQSPLKFYHQDIHEELKTLKLILNEIRLNNLEIQKQLSEFKPENPKPKICEKCECKKLPDSLKFDLTPKLD